MIFTESPVYVWSLTTFSVPQSTLALCFYFSLAFRHRVRDTLILLLHFFSDFPTRQDFRFQAANLATSCIFHLLAHLILRRIFQNRKRYEPTTRISKCAMLYLKFISKYYFFRQFEGNQNLFRWRFEKCSRINGFQNLSFNSICLLFRPLHSCLGALLRKRYSFKVTDDDHNTARLNQNIP